MTWSEAWKLESSQMTQLEAWHWEKHRRKHWVIKKSWPSMELGLTWSHRYKQKQWLKFPEALNNPVKEYWHAGFSILFQETYLYSDGLGRRRGTRRCSSRIVKSRTRSKVLEGRRHTRRQSFGTMCSIYTLSHNTSFAEWKTHQSDLPWQGGSKCRAHFSPFTNDKPFYYFEVLQ